MSPQPRGRASTTAFGPKGEVGRENRNLESESSDFMELCPVLRAMSRGGEGCNRALSQACPWHRAPRGAFSTASALALHAGF